MDSGTPTLGEQEGQLSPLLSFTGGRRARVALHTELLLSLLSCKGAFSGVVDSLVKEKLSGGKPPDPHLIVLLL